MSLLNISFLLSRVLACAMVLGEASAGKAFDYRSPGVTGPPPGPLVTPPCALQAP